MFWYEKDVEEAELRKANHSSKDSLVFYGSSSIRLWQNVQQDFPNYNTLNLGFGGSTLAACVWYFNKLLKNVNPIGFVIYAGDNDLGDGRHPEEVFIFYKHLIALIRQKFGTVPVLFLSIKPSIQRFNIIEQIKFTNKIIELSIEDTKDNVFFVNIYNHMLDTKSNPLKDLFEPDGLHINDKAYALWTTVVTNCITQNNIFIKP